ncbi:MAG: hypothetical protein V3V75_05850, partial [Thermoguttaceae bacterium]
MRVSLQSVLYVKARPDKRYTGWLLGNIGQKSDDPLCDNCSLDPHYNPRAWEATKTRLGGQPQLHGSR